MRPIRLPHLLLAGAAVFVAAGVALACGPYGTRLHPTQTRAAAPETIRIKLPGDVARGVVRGDMFYAITANGRFVAVDLKASKVRDYGTLDAKLMPQLDVASGRACIAAGGGKLLLVDLYSGKATRSLTYPAAVAGLGFLGADRLYVQGSAALTILDASSGKTIASIDQGAVKGAGHTSEGQPGVAHDSVRQRLYVPIAGPKTGLGVFDLKAGKMIEAIPMPAMGYGSFYGDVRQTGDRVYILGLRYGYGVWTNHFGYVDLKERKYVRVALPSRDLQGASLLAVDNGALLLCGGGGCYRYGADGKLAGSVGPNAVTTRTAVLGLWNGRAVRGAASALEIVPLAPQTARAK